MNTISNKRKRVNSASGYTKKPRFDNNGAGHPWGGVKSQPFVPDRGRNLTNPYSYRREEFQNWPAAFPPPAPPAPEKSPTPQSSEDEEVLKPPLPILPLEQSYFHSTFWHRSVGSVFPLLPQTHFATSHISDVPAVFLPKPPLNRVQNEFCPNPHLFQKKFRPIKPSSAGQGAKQKRSKQVSFLHVFEDYGKNTEQLETICQEWKKTFSKSIKYRVDQEDAKALCRNGNLWFGQFCLVCERELSHKSAGPHFRGRQHLRKFQNAPVEATYERVDPVFVPQVQYVFRPTTKEHKKPFPLFGRSAYRLPNFLSALGFDSKVPQRILVLGDFDMTFSLGINQATHGGKKNTVVCAPFKVEDSDHRIKRNMTTCTKIGIEIVKDLKLDKDSFKEKFPEPFDKVFVLFPRVSFLTNLADPLNSRFLQKVFNLVNRNTIIRPDGYLHILMKRREFIEWDVCTVALQEKLYLQRAVFHQTGALHPFEPRQHANSKAKKLNGIKAPLFYIFARTRDQGMSGINPWISAEENSNSAKEVQEAPAPEVKIEAEDADAVLQNLEEQLQIKKEEVDDIH